MLWLKSCRRCNGDLYLDWDGYGYFVSCLQCGYLSDLARMDTSTAPLDIQETAMSVQRRAVPVGSIS